MEEEGETKYRKSANNKKFEDPSHKMGFEEEAKSVDRPADLYSMEDEDAL